MGDSCDFGPSRPTPSEAEEHFHGGPVKKEPKKVEPFEAYPSDLIPGAWQHFKGPVYQVLGVARHSETGETLVIYWSDEHKHWCARPKDSFLGKVERPEQQYHGPRFWRVGNWWSGFVEMLKALCAGGGLRI